MKSLDGRDDSKNCIIFIIFYVQPFVNFSKKQNRMEQNFTIIMTKRVEVFKRNDIVHFKTKISDI
jgi:hypothetical protein